MPQRFEEAPPTSPTVTSDLSAEIAAAVERRPGDQVRCRQIGAGLYRCNWWSPRPELAVERGHVPGLGCTELRVRKSGLFRAAKPSGELLIQDMTSVARGGAVK